MINSYLNDRRPLQIILKYFLDIVIKKKEKVIKIQTFS